MFCKRTRQTRSVGGVSHASRLVYDSPQKRNYTSTIEIRISLPITMPALKLLPSAIGLLWVGVNMQASVASLTTVARIN
jgi:hypothetical protein